MGRELEEGNGGKGIVGRKQGLWAGNWMKRSGRRKLGGREPNAIGLGPFSAYWVMKVVRPSGCANEACDVCFAQCFLVELLHQGQVWQALSPSLLLKAVEDCLEAYGKAGWLAKLPRKYHWLLHLHRGMASCQLVGPLSANTRQSRGCKSPDEYLCL